MLRWRRPIAFVNARVEAEGATASSIRFADTVIGIDERPARGDVVIDLDGAFVLPGLINAHDHLELNHFGRLKTRDRYDNASDWIDDMRPRLRTDPAIRAGTAHPLAARLFVGGVKNLLAGVTTVAHHNPLYRELRRRFPVRLVTVYGWAHSLGLQNEPVGARGEPGGDVQTRCEQTPAAAPFIVHAAEGIDQQARAEIPRLAERGCLRANTVLVHGVGMTLPQWLAVLSARSSLVWCPGSNTFLFGRTAPVREFLDAADYAWRHVCIGSDSRVTGGRDLLDELRMALQAAPVTARELLRMVTSAAARVLRLPHGARIAVGTPADLVVLSGQYSDAAEALLAATRSNIRLVTVAGRPSVGGPELAAAFGARGVSIGSLLVDGVARIADRTLVRAIRRCPIQEPGVACR